MKNSCKDCDKRKVGCHSDCEIYKRMQEKQAEINKRKRLDSYTGNSGWNYSHRSKRNG